MSFILFFLFFFLLKCIHFFFFKKKKSENLPWVSPDLESKALTYIYFEFSLLIVFFFLKMVILLKKWVKLNSMEIWNIHMQIFKLRDNDCKTTYTSKGVSEISPNIYILLTPFIFIIYLFFHYVMS